MPRPPISIRFLLFSFGLAVGLTCFPVRGTAPAAAQVVTPPDHIAAMPAGDVPSGDVPSGDTDGSEFLGAGHLLGLVRQGGPMLIPLGVCSFLLFLFVFERAISLRRGRVVPKPFVRRILGQLEDGALGRREALQRCRENGSPVAEVFAAGIMKWDRPAVEVEQAIIDTGERVANGLRRYLRLFNGISTISPLLGLLGTVLGMMRAFHAIATVDAMGKPELLATGISQALLTTAAGLTVAIPAIVAYLFFSSRVDRLVTEIDRYGQEIVNAVAPDGWKEKPARKSKPRSKAA